MSSKYFCLKWTKFETSILSAFESLQNTEDLADVTLTCEGINIRAHKFILSACSPYFRTIFKENPCPHPIVILKDVAYVDLIAIINFMYHGEVLVTEEQLQSFLQTAMILQVSGLMNETPCAVARGVFSKKSKIPNVDTDTQLKRVRPNPKVKVVEEKNVITTPHIEPTIKTENLNVTPSERMEHSNDILLNDDNIMENSRENYSQCSILEAALEVKDKPSSILERSLTAHANSVRNADKLNVHCTPDVALSNTIFIPRKPPESDLEKLLLRSSSESSTSPSSFDRPSEFLQQSIKIEGEHLEPEVLSAEEVSPNYSRIMEIPHHSSQCGNCPHCGKIYSNQSALKYHVRLVHSDLTNMYCCHLCPESFDFREGYKKHMTEVHSVRN